MMLILSSLSIAFVLSQIKEWDGLLWIIGAKICSLLFYLNIHHQGRNKFHGTEI